MASLEASLKSFPSYISIKEFKADATVAIFSDLSKNLFLSFLRIEFLLPARIRFFEQAFKYKGNLSFVSINKSANFPIFS